MGSNKEVQLTGLLGRHGSYSFFKSIKICGKTYTISSHFPVRIWPDSAILSIAEIQLLWTDRNESLCSLKLYFLPENTPEGRSQRHGEDEVIALQDKVIIRVSDLISWLVDEADWDWGYMTPLSASCKSPHTTLSKAFLSEKFLKNDKETIDFTDHGSSKIVVLNYERYIRLRTVLKRLEGSPELSNWLSHPLVLALGGLNVGPNCRLLFAKEVFDYPELEDHELLCNHLAPKLKGKPKKKRRRRNPSLGSESNESESSSTGSYGSDKVVNKGKKLLNGPGRAAHADDSVRVKVSVDGLYIGSGPSVELKDEHGRIENSSMQKIANKLISDGNNAGVNGRIRNENLALRSGQNNYHGQIDVSALANLNFPVISALHSHAQAAAARLAARSDVKGDPESQIHVDMLGPGLSELAQKLERSNALQILPIRPSVIQKSDSVSDEENVYSRKRLKTESIASMNLNSDKGSKFRGNPSDMEVIPRSWNGMIGRSMQNIYGPPSLRQSHSKGSKSGIKPEPPSPPVPPTIKAANHLPKLERPVLSITPVDMEGKKTNNAVYPMRLTSPSPFVSTAKIYGDPILVRKQGSARIAEQGGNGGHNNDILDLSSAKRRRVHPEPQVGGKSHGNSTDSDLLDLSTKSSQPSSQAQNKNIFHSLADLPPPNAMNQLGLRLTSEVTLFPSNPTSGHKAPKEGITKVHHNHNNHSQSSSSSSKSSPWMGKHPPPVQGGNMFRSSSSSSSSHLSGGKMQGLNDMKSHHGQSQENPLSAFNLHKNQTSSGHQPQTKSSKVHKSDHPFSIPGVKDRPPTHTQGNSTKPSSSLEREREREGREKSRESQHSRTNHQGHNRAMPHPFFKMDPPLFPLLAPPMFMPPVGVSLPGMLGMSPGTMEQFQFYKELLQQGMSPQFPGWPLEASKESRNNSK